MVAPKLSSLPKAPARVDMYEFIANSVEEMIIKENFSPGMKLPPEPELAKHFQVSRPTVSAGLQLLEQRGLVERKVGRGTTVCEISRSVITEPLKRYVKFKKCTILDLMSIRKALETTVVEFATKNATRQDLNNIRAEVERLEQAHSRGDTREYAQADLAFHKALAHASHNDPLITLLLGFQELIISSILAAAKVTWSEEGVQHHRQIYEAVAAGRPVEARKAMECHLDISKYMGIKIPHMHVDGDLFVDE